MTLALPDPLPFLAAGLFVGAVALAYLGWGIALLVAECPPGPMRTASLAPAGTMAVLAGAALVLFVGLVSPGGAS